MSGFHAVERLLELVDLLGVEATRTGDDDTLVVALGGEREGGSGRGEEEEEEEALCGNQAMRGLLSS